MSDISEAPDRQEQVAGLLPALAQLDRTASDIEQAAEGTGRGMAGVYEHQAAHARQLILAADATCQEVTDAEQQHQGDGAKGFAARGYDHALHPRPYDDEDIEL